MQGNYIGTDATGTVAMGNLGDGIFISSSDNTIIGGTTPGARNIISGNTGTGIIDGSDGTLVQGNYIGTDVTGTIALGNGSAGIQIPGTNTTIGGTTPGAGNIISANASGLYLQRGGNLVQGNYIGTDVTGTVPLGNTTGVFIPGPNNTIGGTTAGARNIISGNSFGVVIQGSGSTGNVVLGNYIGTDVTGTSALGNTSLGVVIFSSASNNSIGGAAAGAGNTIAFNGLDGVFVRSATGRVTTGNSILSNSIFSNGNLGIDLGPVNADGVTANDLDDPDTGANNLQNFPVVTSAESVPSGTTIQGSLNSTPNTTFTVQFFSNPDCDPLGNGEGETFLGSTSVTTDANGDITFSATVPGVAPIGQVVTATATDPAGNTSEFSSCSSAVVSGDTTPPVVTASLIPVGDGDDEGTTGDSDEGTFRVEFSATDNTDPTPNVVAVLVIPGIADISVTNGQIIEFEVDDEGTSVETEDGLLEIEAPSLTLRVTATDALGNTAVAEAQPTGLSDDNDSEDEADD